MMNSAVTSQPPSPPVQEWRGMLMPAPAPPRPPRVRVGFRQAVRQQLREVRESFSRAGRRQPTYAALGLLLSIPGFAFVAVAITAGFGLSLSFAGMLVGLPLLIAGLLGARQLGALHRFVARRMLGLQVEPPPPLRPHAGRFGRGRAVLADPVGWRACAYLLLKLPLSLVTAVVASYVVLYGLPYLTFPIWWELVHANGWVIQVPQWLAWWKPDPLVVVQQIPSLAWSFARGIHPPVLDHGLGTALTTLAARCGVPVELVVDLPERPSAAIETIGYFCAAELLTNVAKHSGARHAVLEAVHVPGLLRVRVSDDGHGGARLEARGGLAGLADRVRIVDGRLQITSPPQGPTVVTVELPSSA